MNGINQVMLLGTVGSDPETKVLGDNKRVSTFRMATNESYTDKNGEKKEITEWHNVEAWNFLSDTIQNYVKKGRHIIVQGKIKTESYDDNQVQGRKIYRTKIQMESLHFLPDGNGTKKPEGQVAAQQPIQPQRPVYQQPVQPQQPIYQQQPVQPQQPIYQQPVQPQQPIYQQPVQPQQPIYQQPVQPQPAQSQPVQPQPAQPQRQVQQAQQNTTTYMTDQQFLNNMNAPDDLPF